MIKEVLQSLKENVPRREIIALFLGCLAIAAMAFHKLETQFQTQLEVVIGQNTKQAEALVRVERKLEENKTLVALNNNGCSKGAAKFAHYMTTPVRSIDNTALTDICGAVTADLNDGNESCRDLYLDCSVQWCRQQANLPEIGCSGLPHHEPRHVFPPTLLASNHYAR